MLLMWNLSANRRMTLSEFLHRRKRGECSFDGANPALNHLLPPDGRLPIAGLVLRTTMLDCMPSLDSAHLAIYERGGALHAHAMVIATRHSLSGGSGLH